MGALYERLGFPSATKALLERSSKERWEAVIGRERNELQHGENVKCWAEGGFCGVKGRLEILSVLSNFLSSVFSPALT